MLEENFSIPAPFITAPEVRELFNYNPDTGILSWKKHARGRKKSLIAGSKTPTGYLRVGIDYKVFAVHRIIWLLVHGEWPENEIDHINGIRDDNRLVNLRDVSRSLNIQNQRTPKATGRSGFLGVSRDSTHQKFVANITTKGHRVFLGSYQTPEEAHQAYLTAKRQLHAGCTI